MTRYLTNPLFVFLSIWALATGSYAMGVVTGLFRPPEAITLAVVFLSILTFCLGYLTWTLFQDPTPLTAEQPGAPSRSLSRARITAGLRFTLFMGLVALGLGFYRIALVASHVGISFFDLVTHPTTMRLQLVLFIGTNIFEVSYVAILISVASSLFSIGFVLVGIYLYMSTSVARYLYLAAFLLISITVGLTNLSRFEVTVHILYIVFAYCFMSARGHAVRARHTLLPLLAPIGTVALLFILIEFLLNKGATFAQPDRLRGFFFGFYWYIASPLAALNEFLARFDGPYDLGQNMFFPLYKWLCRFHLAPPTDFSVYGEMIFIPYPANVYTYLRSLYEDFGMTGVIVIPYVLGLAACLLRAKATWSLPYLNLYLVLLAFLLFSFYNYYLISTQIYMQVVFGFVLFRGTPLPPVEPQEGCDPLS